MKSYKETVEEYAKIEREYIEALRHLRDIEIKYCTARADLECDTIQRYGVSLPDNYDADDILPFIESIKTA